MFYTIKCIERGQNETSSLGEKLGCSVYVEFEDIRNEKDIEDAKEVLDNLELPE